MTLALRRGSLVSKLLIGALTWASMQTASAEDRKPDTPAETFRIALGCASGAAAAQVRIANSANDKQKVDAVSLAKTTEQIAIEAAQKINVLPDDVMIKIADRRDSILMEIKKDEKKDVELGRFLLNCALLHALKTTTPAQLP